ncbi:Hypothetical predicted protein, partial [Mytilus galloprovincialis]
GSKNTATGAMHSARASHFLRMPSEISIDTEENVSKDFLSRSQVTKLIKQVDTIASDISNDTSSFAG